MLIKCFITPGLAIHSHLIYDEKTRLGAIIDPTMHIEPYLEFAKKEHIKITDILETHVHADFLSGASELKKALNNKPLIHCSGMGGKEWIPSYADHIVMNGDTIKIGSLRLEATHTPGHTPEHLIWVVFDESRNPEVPLLAFTGDLLFVDSVGRPDLHGKDSEELLFKQLYHSLFTTLQTLPDFIEIYPSHGAGSLCGKSIGARDSSTLGYEKKCNQWMIPQDFKKWQELLGGIPAAPSYFKRMKTLNLKEPREQKNNQNLIIDIRNADKFSRAHLKGSINVPFGPTFINWAGIAIPENHSLTIVTDSPKEENEAILALKLIGFKDIQNVIYDTDWPLRESKHELASLKLETAENVLETNGKYTVIDVRTPAEWKTGVIKGAILTELTHAYSLIDAFPKDQPLAIICRSGTRSSIVASILIREGFKDVVSVRGGMQAVEALQRNPSSHHMQM